MTKARRIWLEANKDRVKTYKRRSAAKAYKTNPSKYLLRAKLWRKENNAEAKARDKKYRVKYTKARKALFNQWRKAHREYFATRNKADVSGFANWYVRQKLSQNTSIKPSAWPMSLVECKRAQMKTSKLCRNLKTSTN
jgi:hypothetical protein